MIVCFVPDLMDRSRISAAAPDAVFVAGLDALAAADVVVIDISRPGALDAAAALDGRVLGFAPHVDDALIEAARANGVEAMPRSVFFKRLPELLGG